MTAYWLKLWIDLLDDPKTGRMPDWLFRRWICFLLAAKEYGNDGLLPPVSELAWRLRLADEQVEEALRAMQQIGVAQETAEGWLIVNFKKRQASSDPTVNERMQKYRNKLRVTDSVSASDSVSDSSSDSDSVVKDVFRIYEREIGALTPAISDAVKAALDDYPLEWFEPAFKECANHNARSWAYASACLKRWKRDGFQARKNGGTSAPVDYTAMLPQVADDDDGPSEDFLPIELKLRDQPAWDAWYTVKQMLNAEMPIGTYLKYVDTMLPISLTDTTLTLRTVDAEHAAWLRSRLDATLRRLLAGICGRQVEVRYE